MCNKTEAEVSCLLGHFHFGDIVSSFSKLVEFSLWRKTLYVASFASTNSNQIKCDIENWRQEFESSIGVIWTKIMIRSSSQVQLLVISPGAKEVQEVAAFRNVLLQKFPENPFKIILFIYMKTHVVFFLLCNMTFFTSNTNQISIPGHYQNKDFSAAFINYLFPKYLLKVQQLWKSCWVIWLWAFKSQSQLVG